MRNKYIESVDQQQMKSQRPVFEIGDTVSVGVRIVEGTKERVQPFQGVVIARRGKGLNETFTVRRIVNNEGVERIFPLQSPRIAGIEVLRHGKVRRGKLYYLRDRVGKARKLRERLSGGDRAEGESVHESESDGARKKSRQEEMATTAV